VLIALVYVSLWLRDRLFPSAVADASPEQTIA
jgi:hypothetical protein